MTLKQQLTYGFGSIIGLLLIVSALSLVRFSDTNQGFNNYRSLAVASVNIGRVQANLLESRLAVVKYIKTPTEQNLEQFNTRITSTNELLDTTLQLDIEQSQKDELNAIKQQVALYQQQFEQVVTLIAQRNDLVFNQLDPNGLKMRTALSALMKDAHDAGYADIAMYAGELQESVLLARLHAVKFLINNQAVDAENAQKEFNVILQRTLFEQRETA
ncbi:methyl-accepting chemotaxis protein [Vibrio ponticus]|nr:methyl-accepting chemotaxis protein [Vibrio ponticus]